MVDRRGSAIVHPAKALVELARVATELGVTIHERTPVSKLVDGPAVLTSRGTVNAAKVVLATNAFPALLKRNKAHDGARLRLFACDRAAHRAAGLPQLVGMATRASLTWVTSSTTTA